MRALTVIPEQPGSAAVTDVPGIVRVAPTLRWPPSSLIVSPGLYGRSSLRIACALSETSFARSGLVGPRFRKVVAAAL